MSDEKKVTPESLRVAATALEASNASKEEARVADEAAKAAKAKADEAEAGANEALKGVGVGGTVTNQGGKTPWWVWLLVGLAVLGILVGGYCSFKEGPMPTPINITNNNSNAAPSQTVTQSLPNVGGNKIEECPAPTPAEPAVVIKKKSAGKVFVPKVEKPKEQKHLPAPAPSPVSHSTILLWHAHDATASNPKTCVISEGNGIGLPPYCSTFSVTEVRNGETKNGWLVRVGSAFGAPARPTDTGPYTQH